MNRLRLWLRWTFSASRENAIERLSALEASVKRAELRIDTLNAGLVDTMSELNRLRNAAPLPAPPANGAIRRVPWNSFAAAASFAHAPQPIPIERKN